MNRASDLLRLGAAVFRGNAIVVATRSQERLAAARSSTGRRPPRSSRRPPISEWAARVYEGEIRTPDVPVLTDAYSQTDALQLLAR